MRHPPISKLTYYLFLNKLLTILDYNALVSLANLLTSEVVDRSIDVCLRSNESMVDTSYNIFLSLRSQVNGFC